MYIKLLSYSLKVSSFLLSYVFLDNLHLKYREGQKSSFFLISLMKFSITEIFFMKPLNIFFKKQFFYENIFYTVRKRNYKPSFTSFTTYSILAIAILKLLRGPIESVRVFVEPIYGRGRGRVENHFPSSQKKD